MVQLLASSFSKFDGMFVAAKYSVMDSLTT